MHPVKLAVIILLLISLFSFSQNSASAYATVFDIPSTHGKIAFAFDYPNWTYDSTSLINDTWYFKKLGFPSSNGDFSIAVKDSNISLTHYDPISQESKPQSNLQCSYVRYLVEGKGEQSFNQHLIWDIPVHWTVKIDDVERPEGDGWTYSDGWVTVKGATTKVVALCIVDELPSQTPIISAGQICYPLPELKANILFDKNITFRETPIFNPNATYRIPAATPYPIAHLFKAKEPNLPNSPWYDFSGIVAEENGFQASGALAVTAKNSNITFTSIGVSNQMLTENRARMDCWLNFSVTEGGQQSVARYSAIASGGNMSVVIDNVLRKNGDGWSVQKDDSGFGWLTIKGARNSVSISSSNIYGVGPLLYFEPDYSDILFALGAIVTVIVVLLIVYRRRKPKVTVSLDKATQTVLNALKRRGLPRSGVYSRKGFRDYSSSSKSKKTGFMDRLFLCRLTRWRPSGLIYVCDSCDNKLFFKKK
jgi:hypothetical protein